MSIYLQDLFRPGYPEMIASDLGIAQDWHLSTTAQLNYYNLINSVISIDNVQTRFYQYHESSVFIGILFLSSYFSESSIGKEFTSSCE